jgi:hypothetical protein
MTYLDHLRTLAARVLYWREDGPDLTDDDIETIQYLAAVVTCVHCDGTWHPESEERFADWSGFHAGCAESPCDLCGQPTNTPDACFDCYHAPFGVGWEREHAESNGY